MLPIFLEKISSDIETHLLEEFKKSSGEIVLDLQNVKSITSHQLGEILSFNKFCHDEGRDFILQSPSSSVLRLLKSCGLRKFFIIRK